MLASLLDLEIGFTAGFPAGKRNGGASREEAPSVRRRPQFLIGKLAGRRHLAAEQWLVHWRRHARAAGTQAHRLPRAGPLPIIGTTGTRRSPAASPSPAPTGPHP